MSIEDIQADESVKIVKTTIKALVDLDTDIKHLKEHLQYAMSLDRESPEMQQLHLQQQDIDEMKKEMSWMKKALIVLSGAVALVSPTAIQEVLKIILGS